MANSNNKRKPSTSGRESSSTKKARGKAKATGSAADAEDGARDPAPQKGILASGRRRNPHGIAPDDVDDAAKPTQRAFQRHIRMSSGLLTADAVLGPADAYIDHYDKCFNETDNMEALMREIIAEVKKPNRDTFKCAERLIRDAKVIARGEAGETSGHYGQIAKDIALMPAEHIAFVFGAVPRAGLKTFHPDVFGPAHSTYNQLDDYHLLSEMYDNFVNGTLKTNSRKENNTPGSLSKSITQSCLHSFLIDFWQLTLSQLCDRRYKEVKSMGYRKPILRMIKVKAAHSDDERPEGGDPKKNKGLFICTKEGRNPIVTAFLREQDASILKRMQRSPHRDQKVPETRKVTDPPTAASPLSRVLPVGIPIDFWDPEFYNNELNLQEAMYINTGVAFPLPRFCTPEHVRSWVKMPAKEFMVKYGNDVLALYNIPTEEELAGLASPADDDGSDVDDETTDLDDTEEEDD
ncbi:hypothetical protein B0H13DRAFT_2337528 [Mycena leptocephala]|nr:hypothetical protein B0H13DRAFT_2337528 [Mycena leptocephala]